MSGPGSRRHRADDRHQQEGEHQEDQISRNVTMHRCQALLLGSLSSLHSNAVSHTQLVRSQRQRGRTGEAWERPAPQPHTGAARRELKPYHYHTNWRGAGISRSVNKTLDGLYVAEVRRDSVRIQQGLTAASILLCFCQEM